MRITGVALKVWQPLGGTSNLEMLLCSCTAPRPRAEFTNRWNVLDLFLVFCCWMPLTDLRGQRLQWFTSFLILQVPFCLCAHYSKPVGPQDACPVVLFAQVTQSRTEPSPTAGLRHQAGGMAAAVLTPAGLSAKCFFFFFINRREKHWRVMAYQKLQRNS